MTERPILFSGPMVKALLEGRKTQTRRIMKSQPYTMRIEGFGYPTKAGGFVSLQSEHCLNECPYGKPGDRLWVRETWRHDSFCGADECCSLDCVIHAADFPASDIEETRGIVKWKPSIFMPRWASRISLGLTEVRVQRLQEISEEDAIAEGLIPYRVGPFLAWQPFESYEGGIAPVAAYQSLWESINGPGSWDANPFVWCVTMKVLNG